MTKPIEPGCLCVVLGAKEEAAYMNGTTVTVKRKAEPTLFCRCCRSWERGWWVECDKGDGLACECVLKRLDDYEPTLADVADKAVREYIQRKEEATP